MTARRKVAIICAGGGMRCARGAGFLYALGTKVDFPYPDIAIGSSGHSANLFYYLTGQYAFLKKAWDELLPTKRFVSLFRRPVIDVDYLINEVMKRQIPLDVKTLESVNTRYFVPITNAATGRTKYMDNEDKMDAFELVRASSAVPFLYGKYVKLLGQNYFDGEVGATMQNHINCALKNGAKDLIIIDDTPPKGIGNSLIKFFAYFAPEGLKRAMRRELSMDRPYAVPSDVRIIHVDTKDTLGVTTIDKERIRHAFEGGMASALSIAPKLKAILGSRKTSVLKMEKSVLSPFKLENADMLG